MQFNLKKPCSNCPFSRHCMPGWLGAARAEDIAQGVIKRHVTFTCHKTHDKPKTKQSHCFGALALLWKTSQDNNMIRIAQRMGLCPVIDTEYDNDEIFESVVEMVEHHE